MAQFQHIEARDAEGPLGTTSGRTDGAGPASAARSAAPCGIAGESPRLAGQRGITELVDNSPRMHALSVQRARLEPCAQRQPAAMPLSDTSGANHTGLPDRLRAGVEVLSGVGMGHVRVHYNSSRPGSLNAHAYAQGSEIHLAPGQERHLPHEAWHVVQQARGRVKPTFHMPGGVPINDAASLEAEADVMGALALGRGAEALSGMQGTGAPAASPQPTSSTGGPVQRMSRANVQRSTGSDLEPVTLDDLEYDADAILALEYAGLMHDDSAALVQTKEIVSPSEGGPAVRRLLDAVVVDPATLATAMVDGLIVGGDWVEADNETLAAIRNAMLEQAQEQGYGAIELPAEADAARTGGGQADAPEEEHEDEIEDEDQEEEVVWRLSDVVTDYALDLNAILSGLVTEKLATVTKMSDLHGLNFPQAWMTNLAYCAYRQTRVQFYSNEGSSVAAVAPYLKLIRDINNNVITGLTYIRKYPSSFGYGAEFTVAAPGPRQMEYANQACIHAHYPGRNAPANYAHTKPWLRRRAHGYNFSTVDLARFTALNNTPYSAL